MSSATPMPKYRSHKEVWALKIKMVEDPTKSRDEADGSRILHFEEVVFAPRRVGREYVQKHDPQPGGYFVQYEDGYCSWSPADAFENGYTRILEEAKKS